jgi:uncharacterized protein
MPEYLSPGVYIEDNGTGPVLIQGVGTSTAGFVGQSERGPTTPRLVTSWRHYQRWFGGLVDPSLSYLPWAVRGFFDNGGQRAFVARITANGSQPAAVELPTNDGGQALRLQAVGDGAWGNNVFARVMPPQNHTGTDQRFRLTLLYYTSPPDPFLDPLDPGNSSNPARREPDYLEEYSNLGLDPEGSSYVLTTLNAASHLVEASWTAADLPPPCPGQPPLPAPVSTAATTVRIRPPSPIPRQHHVWPHRAGGGGRDYPAVHPRRGKDPAGRAPRGPAAAV